jgi:hypothetical protein
MNHYKILPLLALILSNGAMDAQVVPGSVSAVTLALTTSVTGSETHKQSGANTVETGKIVTEKIGNAEFLSMLHDAGFMPDNTISGWKLVIVNNRPEEDAANESSSYNFYIVKKGKTPVPLTGTLDLSFGEANGSTYTDTINGNGVTVSGSSSFKTEAGMDGQDPGSGAGFSLSGVLSGKNKTGTVKIGAESFLFNQQITSAKLASISGHLDDSEDPTGDDLLIEGTVSFAAGVPTDISDF